MRPILLLAPLMLCACATTPEPSVFDRPAAQRSDAVQIVPLYDDRAQQAETQAVIGSAQRQQRQAQKNSPGYRDPDRLLTQAQQAAREGNNPRAQSLARQAQGRAEGAVETQRTREAATLLKALYDTTGLSDADLAALRTAEAQLVRGENLAALKGLQAIKAKASQPKAYIVQRGDTLSAIAARESVYGNSLLWPLIWQANRDTLPDPHRLRAGATLKIKPSVSVDEVVEAIQTARQFPARVRIGTVKTITKK